VYPKQIAFNVIPHIDVFQDNGYTKEEMKMVWETQKIFEDENILVNPTAVRVPVIYGHSEAINIETKKKITAAEATEILSNANGVTVMDTREDGGYATPFVEATNHDDTFVSRIREDISHEKGLNLWVVSDNIRKGAALNTIQIAEILIEEYL
jgi:aspartate-semialdehyde dehydrogenase